MNRLALALGAALLLLAACAGPRRRAAALPSCTPPAPPTPPAASPLVLTLAPGVTLEMVYVPEGEFLIGSPEGDELADEDERPQHTVFLEGYSIGRYEVTVSQFQAFVEASGYRTVAERWGSALVHSRGEVRGADWRHPTGPGSEAPGDHPATQVTYDDALAFCEWASGQTGHPLRLPGEAEWEKAARGSDGRRYPWGNEPPGPVSGNFCELEIGGPAQVGRFSPAGDSIYGCADMAGNVWEWTAGPYRPGQAGAVLRGGGFESAAKHLRSAYRQPNEPGSCGDHIGFRVCGGVP